MRRRVVLSLGTDQIKKELEFKDGLSSEELQRRAARRYSSIINMGGTVTVVETFEGPGGEDLGHGSEK